MSIHVYGTVAYDRILFFNGYFKEHVLPDKVHALSVSFQVDSIHESFGGTAGNIAYNLRLLGSDPVLLSSWGDDHEKYRTRLAELGISDEHVVHVPDTYTPQAFIMTDKEDSQITGFHGGSDDQIYNKPIPDGAKYAILAPSHPKNILHFADHYKKHKVKYIFDPGQQTTTFPKEDFLQCLQNAWMFIANDYELALALKKTGWSEDELRDRIPIVITTLGGDGSIMHTEQGKSVIGIAWAAEVVDPTGAGDAYRAGFLRGLEKDLSIESSARLGATVASYSIENKGTQNHTFTIEEVVARHKKTFGETISL